MSVKTSKKGFTLIEMLVSVAIFSLVLMVAMGSILTVVAANRKARALTAVMNNITFGFETMTRALKTGINISLACGDGITVEAIDSLSSSPTDPFPRKQVTFRRFTTANNKGYIARSRTSNIGVADCSNSSSNSFTPITSTEVDITDLDFKVFANNLVVNSGSANIRMQPRVLITLAGKVVIQNINSDFSMQTTVSQRRLNLESIN